MQDIAGCLLNRMATCCVVGQAPPMEILGIHSEWIYQGFYLPSMFCIKLKPTIPWHRALQYTIAKANRQSMPFYLQLAQIYT